jgi:hypothetical protein
MEEDAMSHILDIREGERFERTREFAAGEDGAKWWFASWDRKPTALGGEFIEVVELVETRALGKVAIYRQWTEDPDGNEVTAPWVSKRSKVQMRAESRLRQVLNVGRYQPVRAKPRLARTGCNCNVVRLVRDEGDGVEPPSAA